MFASPSCRIVWLAWGYVHGELAVELGRSCPTMVLHSHESCSIKGHVKTLCRDLGTQRFRHELVTIFVDKKMIRKVWFSWVRTTALCF